MSTPIVIIGGIIILVLVILTLYFAVPSLLHLQKQQLSSQFPLEEGENRTGGIQWPSVVIESPRTWTIDQNQDQEQHWLNTNTDPKLDFLRNCRNNNNLV
jgi:hypothetical protein